MLKMTLTQKHFTPRRTKDEESAETRDFIRVHIWLCGVLFTESALNIQCCSATYHCRATYFLISTDNRGQTFKARLHENPQLCDGGAYQITREAAFSGNLSQLGVKRQKAINDAEICAWVFQGAEERSWIWKVGEGGGWIAVLVHQVSSGFEFKLGYWARESIAGKWFSVRYLLESKCFTS